MGPIGTMMNKALPWNGDEVDMDLRDAARRAARRDGLSLGDWLEGLMEERAKTMGVTSADLDAEECLDVVTERLSSRASRPAHFRSTDEALADFEADRQRARIARTEATKADEAALRRATLRREAAESERRFGDVERAVAAPGAVVEPTAARRAAPVAVTQQDAPQRSAIESKLNSLFQALERSSNRLGSKRFEAAAADIAEPDETPVALAALTAEPAQVRAAPSLLASTTLASTTLSPSRTLDQAIAEISQRQALLGRSPEARAARAVARAADPAPVLAPVPVLAPAFTQPAAPSAAAVAAVPDPGADVFASLQGDISRMSSRLDAIHNEAAKRAAAPPPPPDAAFLEIRSMLDRMRPDQSIDSLERRVQDLTSKIDEALESRAPMAAFEQLSQRIEHVHASLSDRLAATVAPALDTGPIEAAVRDLVNSVHALQQGTPDPAHLEGLMQRLADKLDEEREATVDTRDFGALQVQVGKLAERLDHTDAGFTAIVSVERSLGELFAQMEETRDAAINAAENAARTAARDTFRTAFSEGGLPFSQAQRQTEIAVEQVTHDISELRDARDVADKRLNAILSALNMTLEKVVDRLGALESEQYDHRQPVAAPQPAPAKVAPVAYAPAPVAHAPAPVAEAPAPANPLNAARRARPVASPESVAVAAPRRAPERAPAAPVQAHAPQAQVQVAAPLSSLNDDDDADFLIEPGAAPVRRATGRAPEVQPVSPPATGPADPAAFIAAARRAAQSAAQASANDAARTSAKVRAAVGPDAEAGPSVTSRAKSFFAARRRPLLLALAGIVMLMGAVQVARLSLAPSGNATTADAEVAVPRDMQPVQTLAATEDAAPATTAPAPVAAPAPALAAAPMAGADQTDGALMNPVKPLPTLAMGPASTPAAKAIVPTVLPTGLRNMAEDGSASAQYEVGLRLADGKGVVRDLKAAADWFEKAAKQGLAPAAYRLGSLYEKGVGVARDPATAMQWYETAANAGNVRAMHNLAVMLAEGSNGKSDYAKAATWFSKAALAGVRDSQFNLAILYARGLGIEQSLPQSYTWFSIAAAQGDTDSATKRDEVAGRLDAKTLADAKKNAENFQPTPTIAAANDVTAPPGGWDAVAPRTQKAGKAKVSSL